MIIFNKKMREKKHSFFLRQHIKIMPKPRPSDREDVIRLKFLEVPYRLYYKLPKGYRIALLSILWTCFIPLVIYNESAEIRIQGKIKS